MPIKGQKSLNSTAFHEAGHAVACIRTGIKLFSATIGGDAEAMGRCIHQGLTKAEFERLDAGSLTPHLAWKVDNLALVLFAGPEAEHKYCGRYAHRLFRFDYRHVVSLTGLRNEVPATQENWILWRRNHAKNFVSLEKNWRAIRAVAAALLERETLSGKEVAALV